MWSDHAHMSHAATDANNNHIRNHKYAMKPSIITRATTVVGSRVRGIPQLRGRLCTGSANSNSSLGSRPRMEDVVLVRHGESEGNVAFNRSMAGDHSLYTGEFLERHSSFWRLTDRGRAQALTTGAWMREHMRTDFDGHFSSEYLRAMETSALLNVPDARWKPEVMLRERDWGEYDLASQYERRVAFRRYEARRRRESLFWSPPGGESLAQVVQRVDSVLLFTNRRFESGRVCFVCHGELMWAFRLRFERLTQLQYRQMQADPQVADRIHNCQVLHYSRRDPNTGELYEDFKYMRSVCPWDLSLSDSSWRTIDRSGGLTDAQMLDEVERYPRIYNDDDQPVASAKSYPGDPEQGLACMGISATGIAPSWPRSGAALAPGSPAASRQQSPVGATAAKASAGAASSAAAAAAAAATGSATAAASSATARPPHQPSIPPTHRRAARLAALADGQRRALAAAGASGRPRAGGELPSGGDAARVRGARARGCRSVMRAIGEAAIECARTRRAQEVPPADLEWADACLALGGDGTMLRASQVAPPGMRVVGVNTDPQRSVGKLCAVAVGPRDPAADAAAFVRALARGEPQQNARCRGCASQSRRARQRRRARAPCDQRVLPRRGDGARPIDVRLARRRAVERVALIGDHRRVASRLERVDALGCPVLERARRRGARRGRARTERRGRLAADAVAALRDRGGGQLDAHAARRPARAAVSRA